eukprot:TRINITY_DN15809_c0_g1_i1.p1 TRINITY_DN15809_c0_g1~~TRINITY_DN15809_c0_g1_i1.p1  ORF type:complete len:315 (+),score=124.45 TRINITY_DN15809_c0_g1_i1:56-946(+)
MPDPTGAFRVEGRCVLVTGSCQGLGAEVAEVCAGAGAAGVVLTGFASDAALAEGVRRRVQDARDPPPACVFVPCDLADAGQTAALFEAATAAIGRPIDAVVNCAALNLRATLLTTTADFFDRTYAINLKAPFLLTQALANDVLRRRQAAAAAGAALPTGAVVNVASVQALGGMPASMAYASLKGALVIMTKNNGAELRSAGVRVNAVLPGWMPTPAEHQLQDSLGAGRDWAVRADAGAPMGRLCRARDTALAVLYLLSPAAEMLTGVALPVHPEMIEGMLPGGTGDGKNPQGSAKL